MVVGTTLPACVVEVDSVVVIRISTEADINNTTSTTITSMTKGTMDRQHMDVLMETTTPILVVILVGAVEMAAAHGLFVVLRASGQAEP